MTAQATIPLPRRADILGVGISVTDYAEVVRCVYVTAAGGL